MRQAFMWGPGPPCSTKALETAPGPPYYVPPYGILYYAPCEYDGLGYDFDTLSPLRTLNIGP